MICCWLLVVIPLGGVFGAKIRGDSGEWIYYNADVLGTHNYPASSGELRDARLLGLFGKKSSHPLTEFGKIHIIKKGWGDEKGEGHGHGWGDSYGKGWGWEPETYHVTYPTKHKKKETKKKPIHVLYLFLEG